MTVLVFTREFDPTADLVVAELTGRSVPVVRLDPGDFPTRLCLSTTLTPGHAGWRGRLRGEHQDIPLDEVRAVYYRRPSRHRFSPNLTADETRWASREARAGMGGLLAALDCRWVNHPHRNSVAERAPRTLAIAAGCGLNVPATLITNNPERAREFVAGLPGGVAAYKTLGSGGPIDGPNGQPQAIYTSQVRADQITDGITLTAHLLQRWIDKRHEWRVTYVGGRLFAAEIHAGSPAARLDFRADYDSLTYQVCELPAPVAAGVRALMSRLALRYAALDFLVDRRGRPYLVDVNPNGQWAFVPDLRDPITHALAELLAGPTGRDRTRAHHDH